MVELQNVSFSYGGNQILRDISLTVKKGEFVTVAGPNGAGKTTFLKLLDGLLKPTSGEITIDGMNTKTTKTSRFAGTVGFLFQNPDRQICQNTVRDEIAFSLRQRGDCEADIQRRCDALLEEFHFDGSQAPFSLSRGERQRLALASLLAPSPSLFILDEPTTGLDYRECMHMMQTVQSLNRHGTTVVMVSHDMELILDFASRLVILQDGAVLADGKCAELFRNPPLLQRACLLPPQIIGLAGRLGPEFGSVTTADAMARQLLAARKKGVCL